MGVFAQFCDARGVSAGIGFSHSEFAKIDNIYFGELAWAVDRISSGPAPGGYHMGWPAWVCTNMSLASGVTLNDAAVGKGCRFSEVYEWSLQGLPRVWKWELEGVEYSVTV